MHFETVTHTVPADRLHHGDILDGEQIERIRRMDTPSGPRVGLKSTTGALRVLDAGEMVTVTSEIVVGDPVSESGTIRPATLVGLLFALVPMTLLVTFSARLAGMLAGTVGGVA